MYLVHGCFQTPPSQCHRKNQEEVAIRVLGVGVGKTEGKTPGRQRPEPRRGRRGPAQLRWGSFSVALCPTSVHDWLQRAGPVCLPSTRADAPIPRPIRCRPLDVVCMPSGNESQLSVSCIVFAQTRKHENCACGGFGCHRVL